MNRNPAPDASAAVATDEELRQALNATLQQSDPDALEPLQSRVLAQWQLRSAGAQRAGAGPVAALRLGIANHRFGVGAAALLLVAAIATTAYMKRTDPALEELLEPDLLTLITVGEL